MARDMFRDVVDPSITVGSKRWYTVPLSIAAHVIGIGALLIVPLMASDVLPTPQSMMTFVAPAPPPPPPAPPPPAAQTPRTPDPVQTDAAPTQASDSIKPEAPHPQPNYGVNVGGDPNFGVPGGVPDVKIPGPPPPPPPVKTVQDVPYRPGGDIKEPRKIKHVPPIYPPIAITAKMQGVVIIEATIAKDGTVKDARVLKSVPLLDQAAIDAVRQWRFTPTLLNNVPVEVLMTVTVNFTLGGGEQ